MSKIEKTIKVVHAAKDQPHKIQVRAQDARWNVLLLVFGLDLNPNHR